MSLVNSLIDSCFPFSLYRPHQRECILDALTKLFEQDYGLYVIDAPTGFGKSPVHVDIAAVAYAAMNKKTWYLTSQRILEDQLTRDFSSVPNLKGRSNYICLESEEQHQQPILHCDMGSCLVDPLKQGCKYAHDGCLYVKARETCKNAPVACMNLAYYLTASRNLDDRDIMILDEAHSVSEWGIKWIEVVIGQNDIGNLSFPILKTYPEAIDWLKNIVQSAIKGERDRTKAKRDWSLVGSKEYQYYFAELSRLERSLEKITLLLDDWDFCHEDWIMSNREARYGKNVYKQLVFTPVTAGRFLGKLLWSHADKVIVSSGTIVPDYFIKEAGLGNRKFDRKECVFSVPSDFPPERSPVYVIPNHSKMSMGEKAKTFPVIIQELNAIIAKRRDRKGLLHTFSYENAKYIEEHIAPELRSMLMMQDRTRRDESLNDWVESKRPSVFVSTNFVEGIDLKDERCRWQGYVKIGYPSLADKRVAKRLELKHNLWFSWQAIENLLQSSGRASRSRDDWAEMFILDGSFTPLYSRYHKYFKQWFIDRVVNVTSFENIQPLEF
jgi:Rad3-related DNA helicase